MSTEPGQLQFLTQINSFVILGVAVVVLIPAQVYLNKTRSTRY